MNYRKSSAIHVAMLIGIPAGHHSECLSEVPFPWRTHYIPHSRQQPPCHNYNTLIISKINKTKSVRYRTSVRFRTHIPYSLRTDLHNCELSQLCQAKIFLREGRQPAEIHAHTPSAPLALQPFLAAILLHPPSISPGKCTVFPCFRFTFTRRRYCGATGTIQWCYWGATEMLLEFHWEWVDGIEAGRHQRAGVGTGPHRDGLASGQAALGRDRIGRTGIWTGRH